MSIVGSRAATAYGAHVAGEMAPHVAGRGWTVASGAAYGVDSAAHTGALAAGGTTVAVLACGVDVPYPFGHKDLLDTIAAEGVIASEHPPGRNPSRLRFLHRNRIIAALPAGTLVIEAGARSGTLNTARHARDLHRKLMAVPGPITSEQSRGCHTIIRDWGGTLISDSADILRELDPLPEARDSRPAPPASLSMEAAAILDALPARGGLGTTAIAAKAGLPAAGVLRLLGELAASGAELRRSWPPLPGSARALDRAVELGQVSNQGVHKVLRVAWTMADLAGSPRPGPDEITDSLRLYLGTAAAQS